MMQVSSLAIPLALLAMVVVVACESPLQSPCDVVRCGYGSRCEVGKNSRPKCVCPSACTLEYRPVCGSDGKTYGNKCQLNVATCESKGRITKKADGECDELDSYTSPPFRPTRLSPKHKCPTAKPKPVEELSEIHEAGPDVQIEE